MSRFKTKTTLFSKEASDLWLAMHRRENEVPRLVHGAVERNRTADPFLTMEVLYQLSYLG